MRLSKSHGREWMGDRGLVYAVTETIIIIVAIKTTVDGVPILGHLGQTQGLHFFASYCVISYTVKKRATTIYIIVNIGRLHMLNFSS